MKFSAIKRPWKYWKSIHLVNWKVKRFEFNFYEFLIFWTKVITINIFCLEILLSKFAWRNFYVIFKSEIIIAAIQDYYYKKPIEICNKMANSNLQIFSIKSLKIIFTIKNKFNWVVFGWLLCYFQYELFMLQVWNYNKWNLQKKTNFFGTI